MAQTTRSNRKILILPGDGIGPEIMREVMRVIEFFDKRLTKTEIMLEPLVGVNRVLRFSISGIVLMDPAPEEIVIDTILDPASGEYEVK